MKHFLYGFLKGYGIALTFAGPVGAIIMFYMENYRGMVVMGIAAFMGALLWHRFEGSHHEQS